MEMYQPNHHISLLAHDVLEFLKGRCVGRENAHKINYISAHFLKDRREIEQITEELRGAGIPLCSALSKPFGLFLARDYEEMLGWVKQIESRMRKMAIHRAMAVQSLKAQAEREGIQMSLELHEVPA